jgi:hypothetical protein
VVLCNITTSNLAVECQYQIALERIAFSSERQRSIDGLLIAENRFGWWGTDGPLYEVVKKREDRVKLVSKRVALE